MPAPQSEEIDSKWFVPETYSEYAEHLLDNSYNLLAPELLIAEVCNILWKKIRLGQLSLAEGQQALADFRAKTFITGCI